MPMIKDMKRAIGVMAVLAIVTIVAAVTDEDLVLMGNGCPVGTDRWSTVGVDFAGDEVGFATKADAVRAWLREASLDASNGSILRAIERSERESDGGPALVETTQGLPAILSLEIMNGGWFVTDASWCRRGVVH
jgi:hypothetical protein